MLAFGGKADIGLTPRNVRFCRRVPRRRVTRRIFGFRNEKWRSETPSAAMDSSPAHINHAVSSEAQVTEHQAQIADAARLQNSHLKLLLLI
jgi:hypothetical protein